MSENKLANELANLFKDPTFDLTEAPTEVVRALRLKLYTMFCNPIKEEYSHEAFKWVSQLCLTLGKSFWTADEHGWNSEDARILSCIARLSVSEIQILLPLIERHLMFGDEPEVEEGRLLARSANLEDYDRFGGHLVIIEGVIKCLVEGQQEYEEGVKTSNLLTDHIKGEDMKNLLERLKETMTLICDYLELVNRHWLELIESKDSEKFSSARAALRIISVWLSDDPYGFEDQCNRFLIDLIVKNLIIDTSTHDDLLILALHSICTQNVKLFEKLKRTPDKELAFNKYLDSIDRNKSKFDHCSESGHECKESTLRTGLIRDLMNETGEPSM